MNGGSRVQVVETTYLRSKGKAANKNDRLPTLAKQGEWRCPLVGNLVAWMCLSHLYYQLGNWAYYAFKHMGGMEWLQEMIILQNHATSMSNYYSVMWQWFCYLSACMGALGLATGIEGLFLKEKLDTRRGNSWTSHVSLTCFFLFCLFLSFFPHNLTTIETRGWEVIM